VPGLQLVAVAVLTATSNCAVAAVSKTTIGGETRQLVLGEGRSLMSLRRMRAPKNRGVDRVSIGW
jgi:hypothetical protein